MDFTIKTYKRLLNTLSDQGFSFSTFKGFVTKPNDKVLILRHDVDYLPENSLQFARIQADLGIKGTYYFRIIPQSFDEKIVKEIYSLGHEIGYHYEDFIFASKKLKVKSKKSEYNKEPDLQDRKTARLQDNGRLDEELAKIAIGSFAENLEKLRKIIPVKTICMHGRPMSRWDSRLLWKYYDYHDFGIVGEPYFDVNFDEVLYLTDTGRRWDGESVNIRDKATGISTFAKASVDKGRKASSGVGSGLRAQGSGQAETEPATSNKQLATFSKLHSTFDIICAAKEGQLPDKIMMTFHPQRWTDRPVPWIKELVWQNIKNAGKYFLIKMRSV